MVFDSLACCAAGLCVRSTVSHHRKHQQAVEDARRPVTAHLEGASMEIEDTVCHDQLTSSHGTVILLQPHTSCDACRGDEEQEELDQEVKEVAVEEDTASTVVIDSAASLNDAASVNSEASHAAASSPELSFGPEKPPLCQGRPTACSNFKPDLNIPPLPLSGLDRPAASVAAVATAETCADGAAAGHESAQAAAAPVNAISARIVGQSGKFYTIEATAVDQQNSDLAPSQNLTRRYREFAALDKELRPRHEALPTLPEKSVFFRRTFKHGFMDDREQRLGAYLSAVVADPSVVVEPSVQRFLGIAC